MTTESRITAPPASPPGTVEEVFRVFLKLGLISFGGPIAHHGYFRDELIVRRRWLADDEYADLVALSQFLPGPASSQVGFGIGLHRAGPAGAIAAFLAFTLPSAALLVALAYGAALFAGTIGAGVLTGLTIVAVAIVAQAVWGMARTLTPDRQRAAIAVIAAFTALLLAGSFGQILAIAVGAIAGLMFCRTPTSLSTSPIARPDSSAGTATTTLRSPISRAVAWLSLSLFTVLLIGLPVVASITGSGVLALFSAFYRAGALVFGGGHVVLPLLQAGVVDPGWVSPEQFLAGYGAAQAVPGPLFTFAAYLGALSTTGPGGLPAPRLPSPASSSPVSCCWSEFCPSGTLSAPALGPGPSCAGLTPRSWASWPPPSTTRSSRPPLPVPPSSVLRYSASPCSSRGRRPRGLSCSSVPQAGSRSA